MDSKAGVSTDTRRINRGDVFFALNGERFDGHDFIREAIVKGASTIVYSDPSRLPEPAPAGVRFLRVEDTLRAYGDWAREALESWRSAPGTRRRIAAVTGSSGKTTVKEMLAHVLSRKFAVHKNQGTENNLVGVPKTIFGLEARHEALVLELGTNHRGEIGRLAEIASPDLAAVTRVGPSHLEGLGSVEGVRDEKLSIVRGLRPGGELWLNADDPNLAVAETGGYAVRRFGIDNPRADVRASRLESRAGGVAFETDGASFALACPGRHSVLNALLVIGLARSLGLEDAAIREGLASFRPVAGRLELRRIEEFLFLDDTYNANPVSFEAAIGVLAELEAAGRKFLVAGDMLELGAESEALHRQLGRRAAEKKLDFFLTAGERSRAAAEEAVRAGLDAARVRVCRDAAEAGQALRSLLRPGDLALVKGSRGMKMEKVFECFTLSYTR